MARPRPGTTLFEVVVVLVIVAILVALLLPAVQKVREAANRTRCSNHLKELAAGFHSYHAANRLFPPGGDNADGRSAACPSNRCRIMEWSWAYHILPHIGQLAVYENRDAEAIYTTPIPLFYCPSRREPIPYNGRAKIDYAGNAGTHPFGRDGVVWRTREGQLRLQDITDGTGTTVLLGEKRLNVAGFGRAADDDESFANAGWNGDCELYRFAHATPAEDVNDPADLGHQTQFGSSHPSTFNAVFCDGSLRTIRYSIDPAVWQRACVRNDDDPLHARKSGLK